MQGALLIRGRWVIADPSRPDGVLSDAAVAIQGDAVVDVGDWSTLRRSFPEADVVGSPDHAVLPGFVNAHHHGYGLSHAQLGVPDGPLEAWIVDGARMPAQDPYLATLYSVGRLLRSGVTSVVEVDGARGTPDALRRRWRAKVDAYRAAGLRATLAVGIRLRAFLVHGEGEDARFLATLSEPARTAALRRLPKGQAADAAAYLELVAELASELRGDDRVAIAFGPPGPHWVDDATLAEIATLADRLDLAVHTHASESIYEALEGPRFRGRPTVLALRDLGVLTARLTLAHGVWLMAPEIAALADAGASVVHNPSSNLRLRAGSAPVLALRAAGVRVGLGMDGTTLADDEDMFQEMRLAWHLNQTPTVDGPALEARDVLAMATCEGASITRRPGASGTLAVGSKADLTLIDTRRMTLPWVAPDIDPVDLIVRRGRAEDVRQVIIGGRTVWSDGAPTGFDADEVARQLAGQAAAASRRAARDPGLEALRRAIVAWYAEWPTQAESSTGQLSSNAAAALSAAA